MPDIVRDASSESRAAYLTWLKDEVDTWCNEDGYFEVEWDSEDSITPDQMLEAYRNYEREGFDSPRAYLEQEFYGNPYNGLSEVFYEDYLLNDLDSASQEVKLGFFESGSIWDDFESVGYRGIDLNFDDLLSQSEMRVNVHFATPEEENQDMSSIVDAFGDEPFELEADAPVADDMDNALSYLINQQGHSVTELLDALDSEDAKSDSPFIKSVFDEVTANDSRSMCALTALVSMDGKQMLDFMDALEKGSDSLVLPKDSATIGLFNEWSGSGSDFKIDLERNAVLPLSMVHEFTIEGQTVTTDAVTVGSAYHVTEDCWCPSFSYQSGVEPDVKEDYGTAVEAWEQQRQARASLNPQSIRNQLESAVDDRLQDASAFVADPSDSSSMSVLYEATEDDDRLDSLSTCGNALFSVRYGLYDDDVARDELLNAATEDILQSAYPLAALHEELDWFDGLCSAVDDRIADIRSVTTAPQESLESDIASLGASSLREVDAATRSIDQVR